MFKPKTTLQVPFKHLYVFRTPGMKSVILRGPKPDWYCVVITSQSSIKLVWNNGQLEVHQEFIQGSAVSLP